MYVKQLIAVTFVAFLIFKSDAIAIRTDDLPPDVTLTKTFLPVDARITSIFKSPIVKAPLDINKVFTGQNDPLFKFVWASVSPSLASICIVDEGGGTYLRITSKSENQSWGVWMMPVPIDGSEAFEVSAEISFIPDKLVDGRKSQGEVAFMPAWYKEGFPFTPDAVQKFPELLESKISTKDEHVLQVSTGAEYNSIGGDYRQQLKYVGVFFAIKGFGVAEIRNITIRSYTLALDRLPLDIEASRISEINRREAIEKIDIEKDLVKKAALENKYLKTAARVRINTVRIAAHDKAGVNKNIKDVFTLTASDGIDKADAAIDANDLDKAEEIVEETKSVIKQKALAYNLQVDFAPPFEFDGYSKMTLAEAAQKLKESR